MAKELEQLEKAPKQRVAEGSLSPAKDKKDSLETPAKDKKDSSETPAEVSSGQPEVKKESPVDYIVSEMETHMPSYTDPEDM